VAAEALAIGWGGVQLVAEATGVARATITLGIKEQRGQVVSAPPGKQRRPGGGRKAIAAQLATACPLCNGAGVVPRGVHDHYAPLIQRHNSRNCDGCGDDIPLPREAGELSADDRSRLEQFFRGGPLYCDGCYDKAPTCDDCGWHIAPDRAAEHQRQAHATAE